MDGSWRTLHTYSLTYRSEKYWPQKGIDLKNKRIAVIGTGASGVQTIQETGRDAKHLTVYQRTPNYALPMNQRPINEIENERQKKEGDFDKAFKNVYTTFAGFNYDFDKKNTFDVTAEEREKFYHWLLVDNGGFMFWLANYDDTYKNKEANLEVRAKLSHSTRRVDQSNTSSQAYKYWRSFVKARIDDPAKAAILAPEKPPHGFGLKRPSLEQYVSLCLP